MKVNHNLTSKQRRSLRVRKHVRGTTERPRLTVFRSNIATYVQVIDDTIGKTLVAATEKEVKGVEKMTKVEAAIEVAKVLVAKMKKASIDKVVFDRGANRYHGRVKAVAETVRGEGIQV